MVSHMELPEIADAARNFAVMIRIQGPDPKGLKMRNHAFHHYHSGKTTLSASGMLLPESFSKFSAFSQVLGSINEHGLTNLGLVVTVASIIEPFLTLQHRGSRSQKLPKLIPGTKIDVMVEEKTKRGTNTDEPGGGAPQWLTSQLLALVDLPTSSIALESLIDARTVSPEHGSWEVGWSLALLNNGPLNSLDALQMQVGRDSKSSSESKRQSNLSESSNSSGMAMSTTRLAILGVPSIASKDVLNLSVSPPNTRGDFLLAMGSPFGILSPAHFFNSISVGFISNCYPPSSHSNSLLIADIRCLPGMEGGPVFGEHSHLIGLLTRPLRQKAGGAEIQLVIPWEAIAMALDDSRNGNNNLHTAGKECFSNPGYSKSVNYISNELEPNPSSASPIEKAMKSITLIAINDGSWASGVLINKDGLILTNAHLFEPWRFGKTTLKGGGDTCTSTSLPIDSEELSNMWNDETNSQKERQSLLPNMVNISNKPMGIEHGGYRIGSNYNSSRRLRVRLDHGHPWIWCDAQVLYISKGPLDLALLQLKSLPDELSPIVPDFACPSMGSKAFVVGHGLFGPRSDLPPSVCSGVVSRVVQAQWHIQQTGVKETLPRYLPAMLETTASVHPGASGGAVINSKGHMIGLVTSNARHGGGTIIPHLNFSIPCAALEPIFKFSATQDISILQSLEEPNESLSSVWALMPPLSPKAMPPRVDPLESLLGENKKDGKGSRFAKFISERNDEFLTKSNQLLKARKLSNEVLPSKL